MRIIAISTAVLALTLAPANRASAWSRDGHMAVARIAWKQLSDAEIIQIAKILKAHPHYKIFLTAECPQGVSETEWAFLRASYWSDWVRGPSSADLSQEERAKIKQTYNKPVWHYIDLPYIHPSDVGKFDAVAIRKDMLYPELDDKGEPRHVLRGPQAEHGGPIGCRIF